MKSIAYDAGYQAYEDEFLLDDNPYPRTKGLIQSESYEAWRDGYSDASAWYIKQLKSI